MPDWARRVSFFEVSIPFHQFPCDFMYESRKRTLVSSELASIVSLVLAIGAESQSLVADLTAAVVDVQVVDGRVLGVGSDGG